MNISARFVFQIDFLAFSSDTEPQTSNKLEFVLFCRLFTQDGPITMRCDTYLRDQAKYCQWELNKQAKH